MSTRLKTVLIAILIVGLAALSIYFINYERVFQNKGELLLAQGHKTYIDPGYFLYSAGTKQGAWAVYRKTGETIVTLYESNGNRRFQQVYEADRLLVDSSINYTIVGETVEQRFNIIDSDGELVYQWQGEGAPLFCRVGNYGRSGVVFEQSSVGTEYAWLAELRVLDVEGNTLFTEELGNAEIIDMVWMVDAVAVLSYRVLGDDGGQYLTIYNNRGSLLYQSEIDQAVLDMQVSPAGHQLLWTTTEEVNQYDLLTEQKSTLAKSGITAAGFSGSQRMFTMENKGSFLPPGRRLHGGFSDFAGKLSNRFAFQGTLVDYQLLRDGTVAITTDRGVYALDKWYLEEKESILGVAIDQESTIFVFTDDSTVTWYNR